MCRLCNVFERQSGHLKCIVDTDDCNQFVFLFSAVSVPNLMGMTLVVDTAPGPFADSLEAVAARRFAWPAVLWESA
jgi:hypothetical protein